VFPLLSGVDVLGSGIPFRVLLDAASPLATSATRSGTLKTGRCIQPETKNCKIMKQNLSIFFLF
jgi:hypothetical protein